MPNRILRDWTDSDNIHSLSAEAERFFTRLIMKADDYGRYLANVKLLRAMLFPLYEKLKEEKVEGWLKECEDAGLVLVYEVGGKKYLEIKMFDQKLKVRRSKYPPSNEEDRLELLEGYVYIIGTDYKNPVKIGFSVNPWARLKEITANNHEKLELLLMIKGEKNLESKIHKAIKQCRTKNEWFNITPEMVNDLIDCSKGGIDKETLLESLRSYSSLLRTSTETEVEEKLEVETEVEEKGSVSPSLLNSNLFRKPKIPLIEEVDRVFMQQGGTMEMAEKFFNKHDSVGWYLNGSPITNFSNLVPGFISNWKKNSSGQPQQIAKPGMLSSMVAQAEEQERLKKQAS